MRAMAVAPARPETAQVIDVPEPPVSDGSILVRTRLIGMCGTDAEIAFDGYGVPPPGEELLVLGHESLGEVLEAPEDSGFAPKDLVVGIVRRPDPVPCPACAVDEWDMCRNGRILERGIKEYHGYGGERFRVDPHFAVRLDPALGDLGVLLEPASILAKAWDHTERIGQRAWFGPKVVLITGAGPIGLLAALLARQRGLETYVVDRATEGPKPRLVADLGAHYYAGPVADLPVQPDVVIECTGVPQLTISALEKSAPACVIALTGLGYKDLVLETRAQYLNNDMVLQNKVIFGSVNAARRHWDQAADALAQADPDWLRQLITRRLPLEQWTSALKRRPEDIKVVIDIEGTE